MARLTHKERAVLSLAAEGLTNWEIARQLGACEELPGKHLTRIYRKLEVQGLKSGERRRRAIWMYFTGEAL